MKQPSEFKEPKVIDLDPDEWREIKDDEINWVEWLGYAAMSFGMYVAAHGWLW